MTEDEMAKWHHRIDGHEFGQTPRVGDGQGGLVCYNSWGRKESDMTDQLNLTELTEYCILSLPHCRTCSCLHTENEQISDHLLIS